MTGSRRILIGIGCMVAACHADPKKRDAFVPMRPPTIAGHLNGSQWIADYPTATINGFAVADGYLGLFPTIAGHARCDVGMTEISFTTQAADNATVVNATAAVLVPTGADPRCRGPRPLLVSGSGTQPENWRNADMARWGTREATVFYAAHGFIVVLPDYLGNGDPSLFPDYPKFAYHPYMHAQSEATTLLDSIRAVRGLPLSLSGSIMLVGGSQGAHAGMAAVLLARAYYPDELHIVAAAFNAGPYDLPAMIDLSRTTPEITAIYDKAVASWAKAYNGGVPLSFPKPDEITPLAERNDLLHAAIPDLGFQAQLCSTSRDKVVPLAFTIQMQAKLGAQAVPLRLLPDDEIDRGTAAFAALHGDAHSVGGALCIAEEWAYFDARK